MRRLSWFLVWAGLTVSSPAFGQADPLQQGRAALEKKDFARAIAAFTEAIRANPKDAKAYWAYKQNDELEKALADLTEALRLDPKDATAYSRRASIYCRRSDFDKAIADCNAALTINSKHAAAYAVRGTAYLHKNDLDRAISDLDAAIRVDPKQWLPSRGAAHAFQKQYDQAIAALSEAIRLDPKDAGSHCNRGACFRAKKDSPKPWQTLMRPFVLIPKTGTLAPVAPACSLIRASLPKLWLT